MRPERLVLVLGTGTEIGKTWVAAALAAALRGRGLTVAARKPVQSFASGAGTPTDADALAAATGEAPTEVCPPHRWYEVAMAPPMAARCLCRPPFTVSDLVEEVRWPAGVDVGLVEGAGGVRSPIAFDGDAVDLARALNPTLVVLVADPELGALNLVRLSSDVLSAWPLVVHLNRMNGEDRLHQLNQEWLEQRMGLNVVTTVDGLAAVVESSLA